MKQVDSGLVVAICISVATGTCKKSVEHCRFIAGKGIEGDGHLATIRPVSLLMAEDIEEYNASHQPKACPGDFAENVVVKGVDLRRVAVGDQIGIGQALLEVCQIGKEVLPHHYSFNGNRLLPGKGVFCRVLADGLVKPGDCVVLKTIT